MNDTTPVQPPPLLKLAVELGPLVVFFISNAKFGLRTATAVFMVAIVPSFIASWKMERRFPIMPCITAIVVLVFGGLTLWLNDETFIKLKPTIVNSIFASILLGGLVFKRPLLQPLMGTAMHLTSHGWHLLTMRFGLFFIFLAILNEIVWRNFSSDTWVNFKVFGIMPITFVFMLTQAGLLRRYGVPEQPAGEDSASE